MSDIPELLPDFHGKLVLVSFPGGGMEGQQLISEAHFRRIHGRVFLMGIIPAGAIAGFGKCEVAVAWDQVEQYVLLDSIEECRKRTKLLERAIRSWKRRRMVRWLYGE